MKRLTKSQYEAIALVIAKNHLKWDKETDPYGIVSKAISELVFDLGKEFARWDNLYNHDKFSYAVGEQELKLIEAK